MSDAYDWHELIDRHLRGELSESEKERLAELLDGDSSARKEFVEQVQWDTRLAEVLRENGHGRGLLREPNAKENAEARTPPQTGTKRERTPAKTFTKTLLAVAVVAIVALTASLYFQRPSAGQPIAKITGLSGPLQWTGDGGRVDFDLRVGAELAGGPAGKPMLIYTRSAMLEVVGTRFEVEAELAATTLNVSEGSVRVKRFSDGNTVDVPAGHRVIAAADREMLPEPVPNSVIRWKSQLQIGLDAGRGKWSPGTENQDSRLATIPYTSPLGQLIYTVSFDVSRGDRPPVTLQSTSGLRVRGRISSPHRVYFGVTVRHASGDFAGRFQTIRPADEFPSRQNFEVILHIQDFRLDPSLDEMKDKLPNVPFGLVVESVWCHTLDKQAGLEISEVELAPAMEDASK